mgnify:CR=1 FL=1
MIALLKFTMAARPGAWERVGPRNVFDDKAGAGESGTIADAASPVGNPNIIYAGGQNNGAASGILKTIDMGKTWVQVSSGLFDTRISGVFVHPDSSSGDHVYCGGPQGIWESVDGAASWNFVNESRSYGAAHSFRQGLIGGEPHIMVATATGVANIPTKGGVWNLIKSPNGDWRTPLSVASDGQTTVLAGCLGAQIYLGSVVNTTAATWEVASEAHAPIICWNVALHPTNKQHFIFSNTTSNWLGGIFESRDGGGTIRQLAANDPVMTSAFYVSIDRRGWYYTGLPPPAPQTPTPLHFIPPHPRPHTTSSHLGPFPSHPAPLQPNPSGSSRMIGAEAGAFRSMDGGKSWQAYVNKMYSRVGYNGPTAIDRVPHDYQRVVVEFAGSGVAFPSDQGLFIKPPGNATTLINANGNMSNNIAIHLAVSEGDGDGAHYLVTSAWDWAPIASWDSGKSWPATPGYYWGKVFGPPSHLPPPHSHSPPSIPCPHSTSLQPYQSPLPSNPSSPTAFQDGSQSPGAMGEGGSSWGIGRSNHMVMFHYHNVFYSPTGGRNVTRLILPASAVSHASVLAYARLPGSRTEPSGALFTIMQCGDDCNTTRRSQWQDVATVDNHDNGDKDKGEDEDEDARLLLTDFGELRDWPTNDKANNGARSFLLASSNFGRNWTWSLLPLHLQGASFIASDPTDPSTLYIVGPTCLSRSKDGGQSWSECIKAIGLQGSLSSLLVKDARTMVLLRNEDVPLRSTDGGVSWQALPAAARVSSGGFSRAGSYSWSGRTLVIHGRDTSAPARGEYAGYVWKSHDDGDTFVDETGDLVTMSVNSGTWYGDDLYLTTSGEGILVKRNFDTQAESI